METLAEFRRWHRVRVHALFSSALRDDGSEQSDVDVHIEPGPDHWHKSAGLVQMQSELEAVFGRKVDLAYKHPPRRCIRKTFLGGDPRLRRRP